MFFKNDKIFFFEAEITFFSSLIIWLTIPEYFPLHMKGRVNTRLDSSVSFLLFACRKDVK